MRLGGGCGAVFGVEGCLAVFTLRLEFTWVWHLPES